MNSKAKSDKNKDLAIRPDISHIDDLIVNIDKINDKIEHPTKKYIKQLLKNVSFDKVFKWIHDSYTKDLPRLSYTNVTTDYNLGTMKRFYSITSIKYNILDNGLTSDVVICKLSDGKNKRETNFATLFCNPVGKLPEEVGHLMGTYSQNIIANFNMLYVSTGPSLISCDGEYRGSLIRYDDLLAIKIDNPEIWNEVDAYLVRANKTREFSLYGMYFSYTSETYTAVDSNLEYIVKNETIIQNLFNASWFQTVYNEFIGMSQTHMNTTYKEIFLTYYDIDKLFITELIKKYGEDKVEKFKIAITHVIAYIFGSDIHRYLQFGVKMIPLNVSEVQNPFDIRYKPWREYFVANKCSDLIANHIAPGFPLLCNYYYIRNTRKGMFDNKSQYERVKNSELAKDILHNLYEAQRGTYFASGNLKTISKTSEQIRQWLGTKFKKLSEKIDDPINYTIDEILMSDVALFMSSEFVGRTFADTFQLIQNNKGFDSLIGKPLTEGGYDIFAKYMFDICYNLLAMNKRLHTIHGDFHLNNATIGYIYSYHSDSTTNHKVSYYLSSEIPYIFPNHGYYGCIIDFSRSIVDPDKYEELIDYSLPPTAKMTANPEKFATLSIITLLNLYIQLFPNKAKSRDELSIIFRKYFSAVFKLLTCIDLYMFTIRLGRLLNTLETKTPSKTLELVDLINRLSERYIASEMNNLISNPETVSKQILDNEWPIETIIKKAFAEFHNVQFKKPVIITDCYKLNNPFVYSLSKYDMFPEAVKKSMYVVNGVDHNLTEINNNRSVGREAFEKMLRENYETIKFIGKQYRDKIDIAMQRL
jgi:hypothetical protein